MVRAFVFCLAITALAHFRLAGQIQLVNMVPPEQQRREFPGQRAEPDRQSRQPRQIAATAITTDPRYGAKGPIYQSVNGGLTGASCRLCRTSREVTFPYVDATVSFRRQQHALRRNSEIPWRGTTPSAEYPEGIEFPVPYCYDGNGRIESSGCRSALYSGDNGDSVLLEEGLDFRR